VVDGRGFVWHADGQDRVQRPGVGQGRDRFRRTAVRVCAGSGPTGSGQFSQVISVAFARDATVGVASPVPLRFEAHEPRMRPDAGERRPRFDAIARAKNGRSQGRRPVQVGADFFAAPQELATGKARMDA